MKQKINKTNVLKAVDELIEKYRNPLGRIFAYWGDCALCQLYDGILDDPEIINCSKCIINLEPKSSIEDLGCTFMYTKVGYNPAPRKLEARLEFWLKARPLLKKIPAQYFTIEGYRVSKFKFLRRLDKEIHRKYF